jgi:hypothetical protein
MKDGFAHSVYVFHVDPRRVTFFLLLQAKTSMYVCGGSAKAKPNSQRIELQ